MVENFANTYIGTNGNLHIGEIDTEISLKTSFFAKSRELEYLTDTPIQFVKKSNYKDKIELDENNYTFHLKKGRYVIFVSGSMLSKNNTNIEIEMYQDIVKVAGVNSVIAMQESQPFLVNMVVPIVVNTESEIDITNRTDNLLDPTTWLTVTVLEI